MTMRDTPGGPVGPTDRGADPAGCAWWWWAFAIIIAILILWWIFARTRPARQVPAPTTTPPAAMLLPMEPLADTEKAVLKTLAAHRTKTLPPLSTPGSE